MVPSWRDYYLQNISNPFEEVWEQWKALKYQEEAYEQMESKAVNKVPDYYIVKPKEVADIIDIVESLGDYHGFCRGNILKYIYRSGKKGNRLEDLYKARDYMNRYIDIIEKQEKEYLNHE